MVGHAVRKDALCMIGGMASFPIPSHQMQGEDWQRFGDFLERVEKFLKRKFGKALVIMTVHEDEQYPHVHFCVVQEAGEGTFTLIGLHRGITAKERVGKAGTGGAGTHQEAERRLRRSHADFSGRLLR